MSERDLHILLETLTVSRRPGRFCFVPLSEVGAGVTPAATVVEDEGVAAVVSIDQLAGEVPAFVAAWLTLDVHSDLAAVGLTAAVSSCLAAEGIACNLLAGLIHDHLLVPEADAARAIAALTALARRSGSRKARSPDQDLPSS
jgi:hypothetical protein